MHCSQQFALIAGKLGVPRLTFGGCFWALFIGWRNQTDIRIVFTDIDMPGSMDSLCGIRKSRATTSNETLAHASDLYIVPLVVGFFIIISYDVNQDARRKQNATPN
jgi:hypothetical protein